MNTLETQSYKSARPASFGSDEGVMSIAVNQASSLRFKREKVILIGQWPVQFPSYMPSEICSYRDK